MKPVNGQVLGFELPIGQINVKASTNATEKFAGKYFVHTQPHPEVNPTGRFAYTEAQLIDMAQFHGLHEWKVLAAAARKGDAVLIGKAVYREEGTVSPDNPKITYKTSWWDTTDVRIDFGDLGSDFVDQFLLASLSKAEDASRQEEKKTARASRMAILMQQITDKSNDEASEEKAELEDETDGTAKGATAKGKGGK